MRFLEFIKSRERAVAAPANDQVGPGPETAKQMYTREAVQDKANSSPVAQMNADQLSKAQALGAKIQTVSTEPDPNAPTPASPTSAPAPTGGAENQQPMIQPSMSQDNGAPPLSPTSAQMGTKEADIPVRPADTPAPSAQAQKPSRSMSPDF